MAKKTNINKTTKTKKKEIDVINVDSIMEDMKDLALNAPVEEPKIEKEKAPIEEVVETVVEEKETEEVQTENEGENVVDDTKDDTKKDASVDEEEDTKDDTKKDTSVDEEEEITEDLSFVDEIKNKGVSKDTTKVETENKPKSKQRKSYAAMFAQTWMGYGYSE